MDDERPGGGALPAWLPVALAVALLAAQPIQYVLLDRFGEPYPALFMPAFEGTTTDEQGRFRPSTVVVTVTFRDGSEEVVSTDDLLEPVPKGFRPAMLRVNFTSNRSPPPPEYVPPDFEGASPIDRLLRRSLPGYMAAAMRGKYEPTVPTETRRWLKDRLEEMFPGRSARNIRFTWERSILVFPDPDPVGAERIGVLDVPLGDLP